MALKVSSSSHVLRNVGKGLLLKAAIVPGVTNLLLLLFQKREKNNGNQALFCNENGIVINANFKNFKLNYICVATQ